MHTFYNSRGQKFSAYKERMCLFYVNNKYRAFRWFLYCGEKTSGNYRGDFETLKAAKEYAAKHINP